MDRAQGAAARAALRWAAGIDEPPAPAATLDEDLLAQLIDQHALVGRVLRRADQQRPTWFTATLGEHLRDLSEQAGGTLRSHTAAAAEIAGQLPNGRDVVLIKGISTYLITGRQHTIRCGDVDLVCADGQALVKVLEELGYRRTRGAFMHEIGEFTRVTTEVDAHEFFPVYRYPETVRGADLDPTAHPGIWEQPPSAAPMCRIDHADLLRASITAGGCGVLTVPDPCLLAIVLCAHSFMNFTNAWSISHRHKPYVRIGELADLQDLAADPRFDADRFHALVQRFAAQDAVGWAAWACLQVLGESPLPPLPGAGVDGSPHRVFPRCLWWDLWVGLPVDATTLVNPDWWDMRALVAAVGGTDLPLVDGSSPPLPLGGTPHGAGLTRRLRLAADAPDPEWTATLRWTVDELAVDVALPRHPRAATERIRVDFGRTGTEWICRTGSGTQTTVGEQATVELVEADGRRHVTLRFPSAALPVADGVLALLIGVLEQDENGDVRHATLVPLTTGPLG